MTTTDDARDPLAGWDLDGPFTVDAPEPAARVDPRWVVALGAVALVTVLVGWRRR